MLHMMTLVGDISVLTFVSELFVEQCPIRTCVCILTSSGTLL